MRHAGEAVIDNIQVSLTARVPDGARDYAVARIAPLARYAPMPVDDAAVRLTTTSARRARPRVVAHVRLAMAGLGVNAEAEAETYTEAIDLVRDRVTGQLLKLHN